MNSQTLVDDDGTKGYFAAMLIAGSIAMSVEQLGTVYGIGPLDTVGIVLIVGAALFVSGAVILAAICRLRENDTGPWCRLTSS